jgi:hypothetical protein
MASEPFSLLRALLLPKDCRPDERKETRRGVCMRAGDRRAIAVHGSQRAELTEVSAYSTEVSIVTGESAMGGGAVRPASRAWCSRYSPIFS